MRRLVGAWPFLLFALGATPCRAQEGRFAVEGFGTFAKGAKTADLNIDPEQKIGGGGGFGYKITEKFQIRADVATLKWDGAFTRTSTAGLCAVLSGGLVVCFSGTSRQDINQELKNTPIFAGGRFFFTTGSIRPYVEGGAGINSLSFTETVNSRPTVYKKTKVGVIPGGGIEVKLGDSFGVGAGVRYYLVPKGVGTVTGVEPSFFAVTVSAVVHF